jgi:hypothetical protein
MQFLLQCAMADRVGRPPGLPESNVSGSLTPGDPPSFVQRRRHPALVRRLRLRPDDRRRPALPRFMATNDDRSGRSRLAGERGEGFRERAGPGCRCPEALEEEKRRRALRRFWGDEMAGIDQERPLLAIGAD